jgi:deoxyadenosine/deoxycytidine kinase
MSSSTETDWQNRRSTILKRLHNKYDSFTDYMRNLPTIPYNENGKTKLISPNDAIREVEHLSDAGRAIISALEATA